MVQTKDPTEAIGAGNSNCNVWLAPVGTAFPATMSVAFAGASGWDNLGVLKDPPSFPSPGGTENDIEAWNLDDPIAKITTGGVSTVTLNPAQCNRLTFQLYFGNLVFSTITGGIHIEPDPAGGKVEKAFCLELVDGIVGGKVLRIGWRRAVAGEPGDISMDKADIVNFQMTLTRLAPASGTAFFIDSNIDGLVTP